MKTCPTCHNTFDDNLRFCQNDGTPLLDDAPVDPFQTMVAGKPAEDEPLQIPDFDPMKTVVASAEEQTEVLSTPPAPSFGDLGSLPSPPPESFSPPPPPSESSMPPPIGQPESQPIPPPPSTPSFAEPEQIYQPPPSPFDSPFSPPQAGGAPDWNPPPAPVQQWGDQASGFGSNTPFQPPGAAVGQNKTLAIISMICGILSIPGMCCWVGILLGPAGIIMGFIAKNKATADPMNYGGKGMALAGIITGAVGLLLEIGIIILYILGIALNGMGGRGGPF
jgi:hypothetical protein